MRRNRIGYAVALLLCAAFYLYYPHGISLFVLAVALVLPGLSAVFGMTAGWMSSLTLSAPETAAHGADGSITVTLEGGRTGQRTSCRVRQENLMTGESVVSERLELFHGNDRAQLQLWTRHCGALKISIEQPRALDLLGLFSRRLSAGLPLQTLVLPQGKAPMRVPPLPRAARLQPRPGGGPAEEHELRPFRPGDPLRSIHWKVSAKVGETMVREPMEPQNGSVSLTLPLWGAADRMDALLARYAFMSGLLLRRGISHWVVSAGRDPVHLRSEEDAAEFLRALLSTRAPDREPDRRPPQSTGWSYAIPIE